MKQRRLSLILLIVFAAVLLSVRPASAHADLVSAAPGPNEALDKAPVVIELYFSEPVEANFSRIQVLDGSGMRVDNDDSTVDANNPLRVTTTIRSLPDGVYTVSWKALSLVDSHITAGAYPFAVGDVDAAVLESAAAASQQVNLSFGEILFRWVSYISGSALTGGILFVLFVWGPAVRSVYGDGQGPVDPPWRKLAVLGLTLLVGGNILGLLFQAGQVVEQEIAAPWNPALTSLLFETRYGVLWLIRFAAALFAGYFLLKTPRRGGDWIAFAAFLGIMLTFSLNSHAAAEARPFFPIAADWVHLFSSSFWIGGLIYFVAAMLTTRGLEPQDRARLTSELIPRFSRLALLSVAVLGVTGLYSAYLRVGSFEALVGTLYGRVLIVKTLLALPAFMLGAVNLLVTTPNMKKAAAVGGDPALVERFRTLITVEVALLTVLLLVVGVFTAIPPARAVATETNLEDQAEVDGLNIAMEISPGKVGLNTFRVILEQDGSPLSGAREVALQFFPTTADLPPSEAILEDAGDGTYSTEGAFLSLPDEWQVQVAVRREGQFDTFANFDFPVGTSASQYSTWNRMAAVLLLLSGVGYLLTIQRLNAPESGRLILQRVPALTLVIAAVFVYLLPSNQAERYINPIPPNQASVAQGEAIYRVQCISCHGPGGRGDGPVGLTLNPPPADLTEHTQPGVHPDGRLFEWISFGFSDNQVMPRFEKILTEEERWHVVNYIRTFSAPEIAGGE